jgi:hypothetical protein
LESLSLIESMTKYYQMLKSDSVTVGESTRKAMVKPATEALTLAESNVKSIGKLFPETLALQESIRKLSAIIKSESFQILDPNIQKILVTIKILSETLQLLDTIITSKVSGITLTENIEIDDAYRRIVNLGNLLVNMFATIVADDISDHFDTTNLVILDDISGRFGSEL